MFFSLLIQILSIFDDVAGDMNFADVVVTVVGAGDSMLLVSINDCVHVIGVVYRC